MYLYIGVVTVVMYLLLSYFDDQKNIRANKPPSPVGVKVMLGFFAFIVGAVGVYLLKPVIEGMVGGGSDAVVGGTENVHLKNILEEVEVGLPKF